VKAELCFRCCRRWFVIATVVAFSAIAASDTEPKTIRYTISLADAGSHRVHVNIDLPAGSGTRDLQLPVWNALYQVRDFSQYVNWVRGSSNSGKNLPVRLLDKSRWRISGTDQGARIEYEIVADRPGPYDAQLNSHHAFFNLAQILMYPIDARSFPVRITFTHVPAGWMIATALTGSSQIGFAAENYDGLVDSPVEIGEFRESDFDQGGGHYRVVVDAEQADYDLSKLVATVRRIVAAETAWMNDRPFSTYLFLYHFPRASGGGGMEHAYSTAIDVNARVLAENAFALPEVTAHEFFHLWNVKRIRPQSLEPIDYTKENFTDALWFSEGVTNTVQDYVLLRAGFLDERQYLNRVAGEIAALERRPAHLTQSAEESSLDAWLEKYPSYGLPARSISYYNKGGLLGVMLDLAMENASGWHVSLRDLFRWMNANYAKKALFFSDSEGVREAAESLSHSDFNLFFQKYVAGREEIPWDDCFREVGLRLVRHTATVADVGFLAARIFDAPPIVTSVQPNSEAERNGLQVDDSILEINGQSASSDFQSKLAELAIGDTLRVRLRNTQGERELHWKLAGRKEVEFELEDVENITGQQKARRAAWFHRE
jgi:predicted metalloprotease with PDZ domain